MFEQSAEIKKVMEKLLTWLQMNDFPIDDNGCGLLYILGDDYLKRTKRFFHWNELRGEFMIYNEDELEAYDAKHTVKYREEKNIKPR